MPASARPWTSLPGVRMLGVPAADIGRSGAIIDCIAIETSQNAGHNWPFTMSEGEMREMCGKEVCDISQSIQRGPIKKLGTITTATTLYFFHDLVLPGKYFYLLSGYPRGLTWDVMGGPTVSHKTLGRNKNERWPASRHQSLHEGRHEEGLLTSRVRGGALRHVSLS